MRKALVMALIGGIAFVGSASAGVFNQMCAGCHNGSIAPSKAQMKAKFKNAEAMFKAALNSTNPMMAGVKGNKAQLKKACEEVYKGK